MREGKIAVIGDKDLILAFKAISMEVFCADTKEEGEKTLEKVGKKLLGYIYYGKFG